MILLYGNLLVNNLRRLAENAKKRLWIATPFLGKWVAVRRILSLRWFNTLNINSRILLDISNKNGINAESLSYFKKRAEIKTLEGLHAKIFIIDNNVIITSANLTNTAFSKRYEIGILLDSKLSKHLIKIYKKWWNKNAQTIPLDWYPKKTKKSKGENEENNKKNLPNLWTLPSDPGNPPSDPIIVSLLKTKTKEFEEYKDYCNKKRIEKRCKKENEAIKILGSNVNNFDKNKLKKFLETINTDYWNDEYQKNRFGSMIGGQNQELILSNNIKSVKKLILEVFFNERIDNIEKLTKNLKGIKDGFVSILLYLKNRNHYNIYSPYKLELGLRKIFNIKKKFTGTFGERYLSFNQLANKYKLDHKYKPQALDIIFAVKGSEESKLKV